MRVRNPNHVAVGPHDAQVRRIRPQVAQFMAGIPAAQRSASFDEIRATLPPPDRNALDGVIYQALADEGFGDNVES